MHPADTVTRLFHQALTLLVLALMLSILAACGDAREQVATKADGTINKAAHAALTPLDDVGIRRGDIPEELKMLVENPYSTPKPLKCTTVKSELAKLDELLGPDMDAPKVALSDNEQYAAKGAEFIEEGIVGFVRSQTSIIPFRSIVRSLTGAKSHEKAIAKAQEAGKLRRAYLKGLASAKFGKSCPLAPIIVTATNDTTKDAADSNLEVRKK